MISDIRRLSELMSDVRIVSFFFFLSFCYIICVRLSLFWQFSAWKLANSENYTKSESLSQSAVCRQFIIHFLMALNGNNTANGFQVSDFESQRYIIIYSKTCKKLTNKIINGIKQWISFICKIRWKILYMHCPWSTIDHCVCVCRNAINEIKLIIFNNRWTMKFNKIER